MNSTKAQQLAQAAIWILGSLIALVLAYRQLRGVDYLIAQDSWFAMQKALQYLAAQEPSALYQSLLFEQHIKFQYPPTGLLSLAFLAQFGLQGEWVYNFINGVFFVASALLFAWLAHKLLPAIIWRGVRMPVELLAFIIAFKFYPNHLALMVGQIQVVLNFLFLLACVAVLFNRTLLAGVLIAAICSVKPQFGVFAVLATWQRDWNFLRGFLAAGLSLLAVSVALYGFDVHWTYVREVLPFLSRHGECFHLNQAVNGYINRLLMDMPCVDVDPDVAAGTVIRSSWFPPYNRWVYLISTASTIAMLVWPFWLARRRSGSSHDQLMLFAASGLCFTMAAPIAWVHHFGVMLPLYLMVSVRLLAEPRDIRTGVMVTMTVVSFVLCGLALAEPFAPTLSQSNLRQSHLMFGVLLLYLVLPALMRPSARAVVQSA